MRFFEGKNENAPATPIEPVKSRALRLRAIFDYPEMMFVRDFQNAIQVCGMTVKMNWKNSNGSRSDRCLD